MDKRMRIVIIFLTLFNVSISVSQKQANKWYFGTNAAVDFNPSTPIAIPNSAMKQIEGCSSIADVNGNLLFYTNGDSVWNKNNITMPNGFGLFGHKSSTQSALIVPFPNNPNNYYIFTVDAADNFGNNGLRYSIVDMTLASGLGDVTTKGTLLYAPVTEKLTAVKHSNGNDIWVVSHKTDTTLFFSYLVTNLGVSTTPVISNIGSKYIYYSGGIGQMKLSPDGSKLAAALFQSSPTAEVYQFNNSTGILSNSISINIPQNKAYGVEFSPNSSIVYFASDNSTKTIHQYDLSSWNSTAINSSSVIIGNTSNFVMGAMQLAPDGKIYVSHNNGPTTGPFLGIINSPNSLGLSSNYVDNGISLSPNNCYYGLPGFVQSYFAPIGTGMNSIHESNQVSVFPNPAQDQISISIKENNSSKYLFKMYDLFQNEIISKSIEFNQTIYFPSDMPKGIYYYVLTNLSDGQNTTGKLSVMHSR
jgi:hypothetical protein